MKSLYHLLSISSSQTEKRDYFNDDIYPLHLLDDTKVHRAAFLTLTVRFNDVLDKGKLNTSLSELLDIGDWRKLGGRLRETVCPGYLVITDVLY